MEEINLIEKRDEKRRKIVSIIITFLIQIIFFVLLIIFANFKVAQRDELSVVQVRLADKEFQEFQRLGEKDREKIIKEQKRAEEKLKRESERENKRGSKSKESEKSTDKSSQKDNLKNHEKIFEKESDNIKEVVKTKDNEKTDNSFEEYNKKLEEQKREKELEFLKDGDKNNKENNNDDGDLDDIDRFLKDIDSKKGNDDKNQKGSDKSKDNKNIVWEGGRTRGVLSFPTIKPSSDISKSGEKPSIVIKFTVNEDGNIVTATVLESTGNPNWDADIVNQFKRAKFEKSSDLTSVGKIEIMIKY